jgi:hypothetical protein
MVITNEWADELGLGSKATWVTSDGYYPLTAIASMTGLDYAIFAGADCGSRI